MMQSAKTRQGSDVRIDPEAGPFVPGEANTLVSFRRPVGIKSNPYGLPPFSQPLITGVSRSLTRPRKILPREVAKFGLIYKLGLRLERKTATFDTVVVDRVERPSPN